MALARPFPYLLLVSLLLVMPAGTLADDQLTQERLNALNAAVAAFGKPATQPEPAVAEVCWTPHGEFSAEGIASSVPYGPRGLAARYVYGSVDKEQQVRAVWKYNNSNQPLSTGDCKMLPEVDSVANGLMKAEGPLLPGVYEVAFVAGDTTLASGKITILPPADIGKRNMKDVDAQARKEAKAAMAEIDASRTEPAAKAAERALPLLATVIKAQPKDNNAMALYELAQMIVAVGKMNALASKDVAGRVLDWGLRSFAHATVAATVASDASLKSKAKSYADAIEAVLPKMAEAAGRKK